MLTVEREQELIALFDTIIDAYVSSESNRVLESPDTRFDEGFEDDEEYKYEMSRVTSLTEKWKKELFSILHGNKR